MTESSAPTAEDMLRSKAKREREEKIDNDNPIQKLFDLGRLLSTIQKEQIFSITAGHITMYFDEMTGELVCSDIKKALELSIKRKYSDKDEEQ